MVSNVGRRLTVLDPRYAPTGGATHSSVTDENGDPIYEEVGYFGAAPDIQRNALGPIEIVGATVGGIGEAIGQSVYGLGRMIIGFPELLISVFGVTPDALLPVMGLPLPFVSYGGSSLIATGIAVGMILCFTRTRPQGTIGDILLARHR